MNEKINFNIIEIIKNDNAYDISKNVSDIIDKLIVNKISNEVN